MAATVDGMFPLLYNSPPDFDTPDMPAARYATTVTFTRRSAWVAAALALLLVVAQALLLQHQAEHPIGGFDTDCPVCLSGNALDHTDGTASLHPASAGGPPPPAAPPAVSVPTATLPRPTARGPPSRL